MERRLVVITYGEPAPFGQMPAATVDPVEVLIGGGK